MLLDDFTTRAQAASAEVYAFAEAAAALRFILALLAEVGVADVPGSWAVWADGPFLRGLAREEVGREVPGLRFDVTRETAAAARVGISQVDAGVADTGTLAQDATEPAQRLVSTLPEIHVALLAADAIHPDLRALFAALPPARIPYLALITGPSRTADIERVLTIGVHGPGRLVIVVLPPAGGEKP
jgi:L-lactate dehydrogenase complex protein LldG